MNWGILNSIVQNEDFKWNIAEAVANEISTNWSLYNNAISSTDIHWAIDSVAFNELVMRISIFSGGGIADYEADDLVIHSGKLKITVSDN